MPEIPTFIAPTPGEIPANRARFSPEAAAQPALALERSGAGLERFAGELAQLEAQRSYRYVAENWADATTAAHDRLDAATQEAQQTGNYQDLAQRQRAALDADLAKRLEDAPDAAAAAHLRRHFATLTDQITTRATGFEHRMGVADSTSKRLAAYDEFAKSAYRDPSLAGDLYAQGKALSAGAAAAGLLGPLQRQKEERAFGDALWTAHLLSRAEQDPSGTMADLKAGKYDQYVDVKTLEALKPRLETGIAKGLVARLSPGLSATPAEGGGGNWEVQHNNFGGLRKPGVTAGPSQGGFQSFATPEEGVAAISHQLDRYASGATTGAPLTTLRQIVSTWAPPSENDTPTLLARAARVTGFEPDQKLDVADPATKAKLIEATIRNEQGGRLPVDPAVITKVAGASPPMAGETATGASGAPGNLRDLYGRVDKLGLDPAVTLAVKNGLRMQYDALEADQARQQRLAAQAAKARSEAAENAIIADARSDQPKISARDVANSPELSPGAKLRMLEFLKKDGVVDPSTSHDTAIGLMRGIAAGQVTDQAPIIEAFGQSRLNWSDFDHLTKQLADIRTPGGELLAKRKAELLKAVEPQIDRTPFLPAGVDQKGKERFYEFAYSVDQKIDEYRKAGKDPGDLFNPKKPEYVGSPEALQPYRRSLDEVLRDQQPPPDLGAAKSLAELQELVKKHPELRDPAIVMARDKGWIAAPTPAAPAAPIARP